MSGAPTSADEALDPLALLEAGWTPEELAWERAQERAAEAAQARQHEDAAAGWAEALRLARAQFGAEDPRLATSLTNQAAGLILKGGDRAAQALLREALLVWDASGPWVEALRPQRRARSSTFHLRLASKNPGQWDRFSRERYAALAAEGRAASKAWAEGVSPQGGAYERWQAEKPEGFTDARKLMAATLLIAANEPDRRSA